MRASWVGVLVLLGGCSGVSSTVMTQTAVADRVAMATMPAAPLAMAGTTGLSLTGRLMAGTPKSASTRDGVAYSVVQPELGGLLRIGDGTLLGARVNVASGGFGVMRPPGVAMPSSGMMAVDLAVSGGHDVALGDRFGLVLAGELGLRYLDVRSSSRLAVIPSSYDTLLATVGAGGYGNFGPVRLYAGLVGTTVAWNDAQAVVTATCVNNSCSNPIDSGLTGTSAIAMVGAGVRWQANPSFALSAEVWVPFVAEALLPGPMVSLTLHAGNFTVPTRPKPPQAPLAPLPPLEPPPTEPPLLSVPDEAPPPL